MMLKNKQVIPTQAPSKIPEIFSYPCTGRHMEVMRDSMRSAAVVQARVFARPVKLVTCERTTAARVILLCYHYISKAIP